LTEISYGLIRWDLLYNSNLAIIRNELAKGSDVVISAGQNLAKDDAFAIHGAFAYKAQATASNTIFPARGMVLSSTIGSGGTGYGKLFGNCTVTTALSTVGVHYLSSSTPGMITPVKPTDYIQPMVEAMSLINVLVNPFPSIHPDLYTREKAMGGDMVLTITPSSLGTKAATLNMKTAGTYVQTLTIALKTAGGVVHNWFTNTIGLESTETVTDADVTFPTLSNTINACVSGQAIVTATYDTDAGSTKTYAANDYVSIRVNTITLMGYILPAFTLVDSIQ
jgi:hypothetical protein